MKVKFVDWPYHSHEDNTFLHLLKTRYEVEISENPDFIFYSDFGNQCLNYDCIRIYYTPENLAPDFNLCDYAIGYHHILFEDRYLRFPIYGLFHYRKDYETALKKHEFTESSIANKNKFCNFVYSNSNADCCRDNFFKFLNSYKNIDSGGKYKNNVGGPVVNKLAFQQDYKFSIAFENSSMSGYTTEKIVQAFAARTIPIYWGDPVIDRYFNEKAYINVQKFGSFEEVLEQIRIIDNNPTLFVRMMREPMLKNKDISYEDLEEFLVNIFEKGPNNFRRSNILRGKWYQDWHKRMVKTDLTINKIKKVLPFLK